MSDNYVIAEGQLKQPFLLKDGMFMVYYNDGSFIARAEKIIPRLNQSGLEYFGNAVLLREGHLLDSKGIPITLRANRTDGQIITIMNPYHSPDEGPLGWKWDGLKVKVPLDALVEQNQKN